MNRYGLFVAALAMIIAGCSQQQIITENKQINEKKYMTDYPAELKVITREDWGWQPLEKTLPEHTISKITLHHGGEDFPPEKDPVQYLRGFQSWSQSEKGWIDNPYHYMIDLNGRIYEARPIQYPGDTNTDYDPRGHALICVMGNYEHQILSDEQLASLVNLMAYLVKTYNVEISDIKGHKDYVETLCPGKDMYRYLEDGTVHRAVKAVLEK